MEMTEPQVWVFMGLFATFAFTTLGIISSSFTRTLRAEIGRVESSVDAVRSELRTEIGSVRSELRTEIGSVRTELGGLRTEMNARFDAVGTRIDHLDRDVAALTRRVMGE
ncbi:hypothetical protein [Microbacterium gilvum]|uniref:DUF2746 domain-containing protein n=1 Tax=Microbacterium gilvum TaxID=1336204 RepID=A0ABP9A590_9MICO